MHGGASGAAGGICGMADPASCLIGDTAAMADDVRCMAGDTPGMAGGVLGVADGVLVVSNAIRCMAVDTSRMAADTSGMAGGAFRGGLDIRTATAPVSSCIGAARAGEYFRPDVGRSFAPNPRNPYNPALGLLL